MTLPPLSDAGHTWDWARATLLSLFDAMAVGEVIELAATGRLYLEIGRVPGEIWILASGPPTPDLKAGEVEPALAKRLRALGFSRPDSEKPSWWYAVAVPGDPAELVLAADQAIGAFRDLDGVSSPADLVWSPIAAGPATRALSVELGIPRSPYHDR